MADTILRPGETLAGLERRMRELLGALGGAQANTDALERAWVACEHDAAEIDALARAVRTGPPEERDAVRAGLARLVQLNAITCSALAAERARTSEALGLVSGAQQRLRELRTADEHGESCDVAG